MIDFYKTMPKSVRIGCYTYIVEKGTPHEHDNTFGWTTTHIRKISIAPDLRGEQIANTFLHEVTHAVHWVYGLLYAIDNESPPPTEEMFTTIGTNGICAFWQDNPEALKWWLKALNSKE